MTKLPQPYELNYNQLLLEVGAYDEQEDSFACTMHDASPCEGRSCWLPAILLPKLTGQFGEPGEFTGRTFLVETPV